ncbi:MAG: extracellular solute-binding protein, partial [Clostridia bacterium]
MRKKTHLLASLLISVILLSSCATPGGSDVNQSMIDKPSIPGETSSLSYDMLTAEEWLSTFETVDYKGYAFTIATSKDGRFSYNEEQNSKINQAIEKRNKLVSDKYNIKITERYVKENEIVATLTANANAGLQYSDLISVSMTSASKLAYSGSLMNLLSVPYVNFDALYMSDLAKKSLANHTAYSIYNDFSMCQDQLWCVFYNKTLLKTAGLEDPSALYKRGEWTWDKLIEFSHKIAAVTMKKDSPNLLKDVFGFSSYGTKNELIQTIFESSGLSSYLQSYKSDLTLNTNVADLDLAATKTRQIINDKSYYSLNGDNAKNTFASGRTAFLLYTLEFSKLISNSSLDWAIVPLPKLIPNQTNTFSLLDNMSAGISVPACQTDSIRTGRILNALFAASHDY